MSIWYWVGASILALGSVAFSIYRVGSSIAPTHSVERSALVALSTADVASHIRSVTQYSTWRGDVTVEMRSRQDELRRQTYVEHKDGMKVGFELTEVQANALFKVLITDEHLPFGGTWTISLEPHPAGTSVSIREDGFIRDPLYRFFARYFFGYGASIEEYLAALARIAEKRSERLN